MTEPESHMKDPELVVANSGNPFKSENTAKAAMVTKGIDGEIVPVGNGFAIQPHAPKPDETDETTKTSEPVKATKGSTFRAGNYNDELIFDIVKDKDGVQKKAPFETEELATQYMGDNGIDGKIVGSGEGFAIQPPPEKYFVVKFHYSNDPNADEDVVLGCNGDIVQCSRNVNVTLPERFLEVARNGTHDRFSQMPGQERKAIASMMTYPFDVIGSGEKKNFLSAMTGRIY